MFVRSREGKSEYRFEGEWYMSECVIQLGTVGTVIGFIYMLYSVFTNLNIDDTYAVQQSLSMMAQGMGHTSDNLSWFDK